MKTQTISLSALILAFLPIILNGQTFKSNIFLRTPQVVNYNFNESKVAYSPVLSTGIGFSHKSKFIELATFIDHNDLYGYYTFFRTTLKTKEVAPQLNLYLNWFGEVTYVPKQLSVLESFTYTSGLCFFLNYQFDWGSIGIPLCFGAAYNQRSISLNTRTIFNLSLHLN